jgi:hypothetical protein
MISAPDPNRKGGHTAARWLIVALWIAVIYATIPFVRAAQAWMVSRWERETVGRMILLFIVLATVSAIVGLLRLHPRPSTATVLWLIAVAAVFVWWAASLRAVPEEAVHLFEYGALGILLYRALRPRIEDPTVFVVAALLAVLVGTVDEIIQWITPRRYWDFRDIFLNVGACVLALVAAWKVDSPKGAIGERSIRRALRLAAVVLALFAVCLSMTPERVEWLARRFPGIGFLQSPDNEMAEYGYRHEIPGVGRFKSRFTIRGLGDQDSSRWAEAAAIIDRYPDERYSEFLREFPSHRDPFVHEARVHIFSRDHHLGKRNELAEGSTDFRFHTTVALRQHQILETFFTRTLKNSAQDLSAPTIEVLRRQQDSDMLWASWTSRHLITWISEPVLRVLMIALIVVLIALDVILGAARSDKKHA